MRYRIRTLLILAAITPPLLAAVLWTVLWNIFPDITDRPQDALSRKATDDLKAMLSTATAIEIGECGPNMPVRANVIRGESLKKLAEATTIVSVTDETEKPIASLMYIQIRIVKNDNVVGQYSYFYPDSLWDTRGERWIVLRMSKRFSDAFEQEVMGIQ
jgi:hypothetical protein